jgi:hypothetical protein
MRLGLLGLLLVGSSAFAGIDYSAEMSARSLPLSSYIEGRLGYGYVVWDEREEGNERDWKYGYVRPTLTLGTIGIVNSAEVAAEFYPVSILGLTVGQSHSIRLTESLSMDCANLYCRGNLGRTFVKARGLIGAAGFFLVPAVRLDWLTPGANSQPFYDEFSILTGLSGGDRLVTLGAALGYEVTDALKVALAASQQRMIGTNDVAQVLYGVGMYSLDEWRFSAGAGVYQSNYYEPSFSGIARVSWIGKDSVGL